MLTAYNIFILICYFKTILFNYRIFVNDKNQFLTSYEDSTKECPQPTLDSSGFAVSNVCIHCSIILVFFFFKVYIVFIYLFHTY